MDGVKETALDDQLDRTRGEVEEVAGIMRGNMEKILEREGKLGELEERADQLEIDAGQFQKTAVKVKRNAIWENQKMKIIIAGVVSVFLLIIIIALIIEFS